MMQESARNNLDTSTIVREKDLINLVFPLFPGDRIFFSGDLGAGKSTFIRALLRHHFHDPDMIIRSPTYTYYEVYGDSTQYTVHSTPRVYHFDLYRIEHPEDLLYIGATDIFEDTSSICLIEWPGILSDRVKPTIRVEIERISEDERRFTITRNTK